MAAPSRYFNLNRQQIKITGRAIGNNAGKKILLAALLTATTAVADNSTSPLRVNADQISRKKTQLSAKGNVEAYLDSYKLCAGTLVYDHATGLISAAQDVQIIYQDHSVHAAKARMQRGQQRGELEDFTTDLPDSGLRIQGETAVWESNDIAAVNTNITSCPADSLDWYINSGKTEIRTDTEEVIINHTVLHIADIPVFYLPYGKFNYSDKKRSGFLWPGFRLGSNSGFGINLPYYLALADNYDLTITPHYRSKHGLEISNEFRFLTRNSSGNLQIATALFDKLGGRGAESVNYAYDRGPWTMMLTADNVSDNNYLRDYRDSTNKALHILPRTARLGYTTDRYYLQASADHFQTLDDTLSPPYRALPQLEAGFNGGGNTYDWETSGQYTHFRHNTLSDGNRGVWRGGLRFYRPIGDIMLSPALAARAVTYSDEDAGSFLVPIARLDAEKNNRNIFASTTGRRDHLRLRSSFIYAPAQTRQNQAPLYDTIVRDQTSENLFEWNRFVGDDRASDARFLAYGGDYRLLHNNQEVFYLGAGQRYYFSDAKIALSENDTPPTQGLGNFLLDSRLKVADQWRAAAAGRWNSEKKTVERFYTEIHGEFPGRRLLHIRYLSDGDESLVFGAAAPVADWLETALQTDYLMNQDRFVHTRFALRLHDSCNCWNISLGVEDQVIDENKNVTEFSLGIEFTGLGGVNEQYDRLLDKLR